MGGARARSSGARELCRGGRPGATRALRRHRSCWPTIVALDDPGASLGLQREAIDLRPAARAARDGDQLLVQRVGGRPADGRLGLGGRRSSAAVRRSSTSTPSHDALGDRAQPRSSAAYRGSASTAAEARQIRQAARDARATATCDGEHLRPRRPTAYTRGRLGRCGRARGSRSARISDLNAPYILPKAGRARDPGTRRRRPRRRRWTRSPRTGPGAARSTRTGRRSRAGLAGARGRSWTRRWPGTAPRWPRTGTSASRGTRRCSASRRRRRARGGRCRGRRVGGSSPGDLRAARRGADARRGSTRRCAGVPEAEHRPRRRSAPAGARAAPRGAAGRHVPRPGSRSPAGPRRRARRRSRAAHPRPRARRTGR